MISICYTFYLNHIYIWGRILETFTVPYYTVFTLTLFLLYINFNKIRNRRDTISYTCSRILPLANYEIFAGSVIDSRDQSQPNVSGHQAVLRKEEVSLVRATHCSILLYTDYSFVPIITTTFICIDYH